MDLTLHYIKYKFGIMEKADVIRYVDLEMANGSVDVDSILDISLYGGPDGWDFEKLLIPSVNINNYTEKDVINILHELISKTKYENGVVLKRGLHWLMYDMEFIGYGDKLGELYGQLDELYHIIPEGYGSKDDIANVCKKWISDAA